MKVFVTGVAGRLGHDVMNELNKRGHVGIGSDVMISENIGMPINTTPLNECEELPSFVKMDITNRADVLHQINDLHPDVIVHCAAWTNVDGAEDPDKKDIVHKINVEGTQNIADACKAVDAKMIYISTDYVFDSQGDRPWQPDDKNYAPLNYYGETKLGGELAVSKTLDKYFIVRIAWVFGKNGNNFIKTMVNVGRTHNEVRVVNDQVGTPTYTYDLARLLVDMTGMPRRSRS